MERDDGKSEISRDLMNKMIKIEIEAHLTIEAPKHNEGQIELSLGLSLNGRFGVDPSSPQTLKRSHSVSNLPGKAAGTLVYRAARDVHSEEMPRTSEERWEGFLRQGEELEEAAAVKKKRMDKMKSVSVVKVGKGYVVMENEGSGSHNGEKGGVDVKFPDNVGALNGSTGNLMLMQSSEGSIGSQMGSVSAGFHFPQGPSMMGADNNNTMLRSSSTRQIQIDPNNEHGVPRSAAAADSDPDDMQSPENPMLEMPHVSTKAEGFKRVYGILYKYARLDELKIVCACHGFFLSPAEFVRHGGGWNVEQPLKDIVINPCPLI